MDALTVADELAFDALPDETRKLCEKIISSRVYERIEADGIFGQSDVDEAARVAHHRGYKEGKELGRDEGRAEALTEMQATIERVEAA